MVVQHNMQAANSNRMLGITTSQQAKSTEKLSSGYKINRAADDAAGLAISEKMRSQIRGLDRASTNAQDGISVVQTAEGALNEVHSMLQRMNELATQAANDTNTSMDRSQIQLEINQLTSEIDRVSSTTQFNTMDLLDGSFTGKNLQVGSLSGQRIQLDIDAMSAKGIGVQGTKVATAEDAKAATAGTATTGKGNTGVTSGVTVDNTIANGTYTYYDANNKVNNGAGATIDAGWYTSDPTKAADKGAADKLKVNGTVTASGAKTGDTITVTGHQDEIKEGDLLNIDADGTVTGKAKQGAGEGIDVSSYDAAGKAMKRFQDAIDKVSTQRATLGAVQNRLEHTIANLDNVSENTQSAESRIRDTDMAKEMVTYSKNNILAQAGQSMLAQANQSTQGVLSLLQ
ncbi:MAG: flagellin [Lachnospiraceae bacterium]|nr:flagellin [Lachnospiraceae bacterium]